MDKSENSKTTTKMGDFWQNFAAKIMPAKILLP